MIADSSYDVGDLAVRPRWGAAAGLAAAAVMWLVLVAVAGPDGAWAWLRDAGRVVLPASLRTPAALLAAGLALHLGAGAAFGALYAASQQRVPLIGLVTVGAFYGFVLWLGSDIVLARWLGAGPRLLRGWPGFVALLAYGLSLGLSAGAVLRLSRTGGARVRPVD